MRFNKIGPSAALAIMVVSLFSCGGGGGGGSGSGSSSSSGSSAASTSTSNSGSSSTPETTVFLSGGGELLPSGNGYFDTNTGQYIENTNTGVYNTVTGVNYVQSGGYLLDTRTGQLTTLNHIDLSLEPSLASCKTVEECASIQSRVVAVSKDFEVLGASPGGELSDSVGAVSHDGDLEQAQAAQADQRERAQDISNEFQIDYGKALQLTRLADRVQSLATNDQLTAEDQQAITQSAFKVAGVSSEDVNSAVAKSVQTGDTSGIDALVDQAAANLGMPDSSGLKDKIMPALGLGMSL